MLFPGGPAIITTFDQSCIGTRIDDKISSILRARPIETAAVSTTEHTIVRCRRSTDQGTSDAACNSADRSAPTAAGYCANRRARAGTERTATDRWIRLGVGAACGKRGANDAESGNENTLHRCSFSGLVDIDLWQVRTLHPARASGKWRAPCGLRLFRRRRPGLVPIGGRRRRDVASRPIRHDGRRTIAGPESAATGEGLGGLVP